ncbi:MAG: hypothetical protein Tp138OMZ00d2C19078241_59 [Prokaryotic dsDNA virus sp.]|jgi:hypothetical protein|nr:MAG: hypothetical protein Tp138OMZ00d2C19078241_59 [Prokaryotic dsDNA virus sp.]|tara:strand:+ start:10033 stop:10326 length:294 start_codon:yes stop_codon:yes gene_type:complete
MKDMKPVTWLCEASDGENVYAAVNEFQMKEFERFGRKITPLYAIPEGHVVVPVEPTLPMLAELGFNGDVELAIGHANICDELRENYKAMLKAAQEEG